MFDLFIVESPSKTKKINSYLKSIGINARVLASFGHIRDLDRKKLSIDVNDNFKPTYIITNTKKNVISALKEETKKCLNSGGSVWLASDFDREGESIAWHLFRVLKLYKNKGSVKRAIFTEITKKALAQAVENPKQLDMNMFYSQQARRILDRLIGYLVSPILWKQFNSSYKKGQSLSAGRVQSVVVKLVKEREDEINSFENTKYYKVTGQFESNKLQADLSSTMANSKEVKKFLKHCRTATFTINTITKKKSTRKASAPFITSTLQQQASVKMGFSPKKTMMVAQKLYENGLITYMRTDSLSLSDDALSAIQVEIEKRYGVEYHTRKQYTNKSKNSQEAHEAIRPSIMSKTDLLDMRNRTADENKLYKLIWKRTIASQMSPAKINIMTLKISVSERDELFIAKGETVIFDGFLLVYKKLQINDGDDDSDSSSTNKNELAVFKSYSKGNTVSYDEITGSERRTKPPHGHFSEASLVKKLESIGVGRPSTYSSIISIVQDRHYVEKTSKKGDEITLKTYKMKRMGESEVGKAEVTSNIILSKKTQLINTAKNRLFITDTGEMITNFLQDKFDTIMDYNFTATVETMLDEVALGNKEWQNVVRYFYDQFHPQVVALNSLVKTEGDKHRRVLGNNIVVYIGKFGPVACITDPDNSKNNKYASLGNLKIDSITLEQATELFNYPKKIGLYKNETVMLYKGQYGLYFKHNSKNYSLKSVSETELDDCKIKEIIESKNTNNIIKQINEDIVIKNGRYGAYISYKKKLNVKIWGSKKPEDLTLEDCMILIKNKQKK